MNGRDSRELAPGLLPGVIRRREFLRSCVRYPLLALLTLLGGGLISRRQAQRDVCALRRPCDQCGRLSQCALPPAQAFKSAGHQP